MPDRKPRTANLGLATFEVVERALRHLSLTRAARELGVSQPTVSFHVDRFEAHFGYPVPRRVGNMLQRAEARALRQIAAPPQSLTCARARANGFQAGLPSAP